MVAALGALKSEGLLSARAAFYVCYPGTTQADRIITVPEREHGIGVALLEFCRLLRGLDRPTLQAACVRARAALRAGDSAQDIAEAARAQGLLREAAAADGQGEPSSKPPDTPEAARASSYVPATLALAGSAPAAAWPASAEVEPRATAPLADSCKPAVVWARGPGSSAMHPPTWPPPCSPPAHPRLADDTRLHPCLSARFQDLEMADLLEQSRL